MTKEPLVEHDQRKAPASWDAAEYFGEKRLSRWTREPFQQVSSRSFPIWTSIGHTLLPSFVSSYLRPNSAARTKRLHDTAYLDGLRGIGAFVVYLHHTHMMYSMDGLYGYGSKAGANHILQLPFIRLVTAGPGAVALFFLISVCVENNYSRSQGRLRETDFDFDRLGICTQPQDLDAHPREPTRKSPELSCQLRPTSRLETLFALCRHFTFLGDKLSDKFPGRYTTLGLPPAFLPGANNALVEDDCNDYESIA